jgi:hypothetical protein
MGGGLSKRVVMLTYGESYYVHSNRVMAAFSIFIRRREARKIMLPGYDVPSTTVIMVTEVAK